MQHIVVRTAKPANLQAPDWVVNGVGRNGEYFANFSEIEFSLKIILVKLRHNTQRDHRLNFLKKENLGGCNFDLSSI